MSLRMNPWENKTISRVKISKSCLIFEEDQSLHKKRQLESLLKDRIIKWKANIDFKLRIK